MDNNINSAKGELFLINDGEADEGRADDEDEQEEAIEHQCDLLPFQLDRIPPVLFV